MEKGGEIGSESSGTQLYSQDFCTKGGGSSSAWRGFTILILSYTVKISTHREEVTRLLGGGLAELTLDPRY